LFTWPSQLLLNKTDPRQWHCATQTFDFNTAENIGRESVKLIILVFKTPNQCATGNPHVQKVETGHRLLCFVLA
jgi:hypothetical protein